MSAAEQWQVVARLERLRQQEPANRLHRAAEG
jgi:hypothetical protein